MIMEIWSKGFLGEIERESGERELEKLRKRRGGGGGGGLKCDSNGKREATWDSFGMRE
jgi:hypothetical protein